MKNEKNTRKLNGKKFLFYILSFVYLCNYYISLVYALEVKHYFKYRWKRKPFLIYLCNIFSLVLVHMIDKYSFTFWFLFVLACHLACLLLGRMGSNRVFVIQFSSSCVVVSLQTKTFIRLLIIVYENTKILNVLFICDELWVLHDIGVVWLLSSLSKVIKW